MHAALLVALLCGLLTPAAGRAYSRPPIRHVFVIVDENHNASTVFGPGSSAPYLSRTLVAQGAYLPNFYGIGHNSLDNYIAMVSGQAPNPLTSADCADFVNFPADSLNSAGQENGKGCVYPADVPTLMSQLGTAGLTWRGYEDGMGADPTREPATCAHPAVGAHDDTQGTTATDEYITHHDPFVYFHSVIDNQAECNANVVGLNQLPADLQSAATTPNYVFITPNACNDGHETPCANGQPGGLAQADGFLKSWVPVITASAAFQQDGLLIITFDEAANDATACCNEMPGPFDALNGIQAGGGGPGGGAVGAVLLSPTIAPGTRSTAGYNHYSMLASVEDLFGLPRIGYAVGVKAFGPDIYAPPYGFGGRTVGGGAARGGSGIVSASELRAIIWREITPSRRAARITRLRRRRAFFLQFRAPEAGRAVVQWYDVPTGARLAKTGRRRASPVLVASGQAVFRSAKTEMIKLRLTRAGMRLLEHAKRLRLTAKGTFTPRGARGVSAKRSFVLRAR